MLLLYNPQYRVQTELFVVQSSVHDLKKVMFYVTQTKECRDKKRHLSFPQGFHGGSEVKASASNAGDMGSIPGSGRSPGEGIGSPLQYFCLENSMDGGAQQATVHGVAKSLT